MDIVERLRREEDALDNEAADEIERLRAILIKIKRDVEHAKYPEDLGMDWLDDVYDALQQKDSE